MLAKIINTFIIFDLSSCCRRLEGLAVLRPLICAWRHSSVVISLYWNLWLSRNHLLSWFLPWFYEKKNDWLELRKNKTNKTKNNTWLVVPVIVYKKYKKQKQKRDWFGGYRDCIKTKMTGLVVPVIMQIQKWLAWWFSWLLGSSRDYRKTKITLAWWFCDECIKKENSSPAPWFQWL